MYPEQFAGLSSTQRFFFQQLPYLGSQPGKGFVHQVPSGQLFKLHSMLFYPGASSLMLLPPLPLPAFCLDAPNIFPHGSRSLARAQPAPALPAATEPAAPAHPLSHSRTLQTLEQAEALPAGSPILTRAGGRFSIKKCRFSPTGETASGQWICNQNYV